MALVWHSEENQIEAWRDLDRGVAPTPQGGIATVPLLRKPNRTLGRFNGRLARVALYQAALSEEEIAAQVRAPAFAKGLRVRG